MELTPSIHGPWELVSRGLLGNEGMAPAREKWLAQARSDQLTPEGKWRTWLVLSGRGWGKTRTAAEDMAWFGWNNPGSRIAVIGETLTETRDTCFEGEAGILSVLPAEEIANWNRSQGGALTLRNGTRYKGFSGDKPDQLRGPAHHRLWADELAKFRYAQETWDNGMLGLRLGSAQAVVTTTPRPTKIIRELMADPGTHLTVGSTYDNIDNLAPEFREFILRRYEGTRLGRQELHAHVLDDVPGALWTRGDIEKSRVREAPELVRVVVAIDPAMTSGEDADETGILVAGKAIDGKGYVLADRTCRLSPDGWARRAVSAYEEFQADRIVAEVNNGGEMVQFTLRTIGGNVPYKQLHASRGKRVRAEPVAALYEQGRVSHVGSFDALEDQMCTFVPDEVSFSPDRVDALVWALTELMVPASRGTRRARIF